MVIDFLRAGKRDSFVQRTKAGELCFSTVDKGQNQESVLRNSSVSLLKDWI